MRARFAIRLRFQSTRPRLGDAVGEGNERTVFPEHYVWALTAREDSCRAAGVAGDSAGDGDVVAERFDVGVWVRHPRVAAVQGPIVVTEGLSPAYNQ